VQLKLQRSQRPGGVLGTTVIFCLDARADYSPAEAANIGKYKIGSQVVYSSQAARRHIENTHRHLDRVDSDLLRDKAAGLARGAFSLALAKMSLNISIASLGRGHHIECKDLAELLDAEQALMDACRNVKQFLAAAATFSGSLILVDFDDDEKVHMSQGVLELAALPAPQNVVAGRPGPALVKFDLFERGNVDFGALFKSATDALNRIPSACRKNPKPFYIAGSVAAALASFAIFGLNIFTVMYSVVGVGWVILWTRLT
jgi:hypothetical protein